ncbi:ribbon-helix-helix domain-containing protein [Gymnodinialimonas ceratoperidinii]|uniref:Ribbon-helix-helix domain-containing protein n=1 Tax=Gymnodinialimonas ceratoperidinii TaxID=2856823 RepID=A0A8F6YBR1_9RHOB|nr:ribbon-helix-helix domain-containing protein [Gymnodinialimonas ceratoperidinii]QXT38437.1 ribbon-helix-helix domain-containing protein [Gymnodinialimonas ceratoperidinii]
MSLPAASARPRKRSLTLQGHRTSVSLEDAFWEELQSLAEARGVSVNALVAEIDAARGVSAGLASAIRVYILLEAKAASR